MCFLVVLFTHVKAQTVVWAFYNLKYIGMEKGIFTGLPFCFAGVIFGNNLMILTASFSSNA